MPIEYHKGNLLEAPDVDVIIHGCNCQGVWGAGIAKQIKQKWPYVFQSYIKYMTSVGRGMPPEALLGKVHYTEVMPDVTGKVVISLQTQVRYGREQRHVNYAALGAALFEVKSYFGKDDGVIGMPKIGCGLAGGAWNIVSAIVEDAFNDRVVRVYEL